MERGLYILLPLYFLLNITDFIVFCFVGLKLLEKLAPKLTSNPLVKLLKAAAFVIFSVSIRSTQKMLEMGSFVISMALLYSYIQSILMFILQL
jgi:hypothetical protein